VEQTGQAASLLNVNLLGVALFDCWMLLLALLVLNVCTNGKSGGGLCDIWWLLHLACHFQVVSFLVLLWKNKLKHFYDGSIEA
jgi:hypothetical protein